MLINWFKSLFTKPKDTPPTGSKPTELQALIEWVAETNGVSKTLAISIAEIESSLNPSAKAPTSSAVGLYQFIDSTWRSLIKAYGAKHKITLVTGDRTNPEHSTAMFCELVKENMRYLTAKGIHNLDDTTLYLCHFLGPSQACKFIKARELNGKTLGITLFDQEAKANKWVFYKGRQPRTLDSIYDLFHDKLITGLERAKDKRT